MFVWEQRVIDSLYILRDVDTCHGLTDLCTHIITSPRFFDKASIVHCLVIAHTPAKHNKRMRFPPITFLYLSYFFGHLQEVIHISASLLSISSLIVNNRRGKYEENHRLSVCIIQAIYYHIETKPSRMLS